MPSDNRRCLDLVVQEVCPSLAGPRFPSPVSAATSAPAAPSAGMREHTDVGGKRYDRAADHEDILMPMRML
jgi:hypothetical protein